MSGVPNAEAVAEVRAGDHLLYLYQTEDESGAAWLAAVAQGIRRNEKTLWIAEDAGPEGPEAASGQADAELRQALADGRVTARDGESVFMRNGALDPDAAADVLCAERVAALREGYAGLRVLNDMTWARGRPRVLERLDECEAKLTARFLDGRSVLICLYDRRAFAATSLLRVLSTHPKVLLDSRLCVNHDYSPPEERTGEEDPEADLSRKLGDLLRWCDAEEALRTSEESFRSLAQNPVDGLLIGAGEEGRHVYANSRAAEITGYPTEELLRLSIRDLAAPDEYPRLRRIYAKRLRGEDVPPRYETAIVRKDGRRVPIDLAAAKIQWQGQPADMVVIRDISDHKQAEEDLRKHHEQLEQVVAQRTAALRESNARIEESERRYRFLFECAPDGIAVTDAEGTIVDCNAALQQLIGLRRDELLGKHAEEQMTDGFKSMFDERFPVARKVGYAEAEFEAVRRDGSPVPLWARATAVHDDAGEFAGIIVHNRDMSHLRDAERALQQAHDELETRVHERTRDLAEANRKLVAEIADRCRAEAALARERDQLQETQSHLLQAGKMAALGRLAAGIAHEINNPLATIATSAEILAGLAEESGRELSPRVAARHLGKIQDNVYRCKGIIDNLLGFARREGEEMVDADLSRVLKGAAHLAQNALRTKGLRLRLAAAPLALDADGLPAEPLSAVPQRSEPASPLRVRTYPQRLQQVLLNLILNAVDATPDGGHIVLSAVDKAHGIEVLVADSGSGMEPEHLSRVFEPFFTTKPVGSGTGLGMFLSHQIVESLQGEISVASRPGRGTVVRVWLPSDPTSPRKPE